MIFLIGDDWNNYAKATIFKMNEDNKIFLSSSIIFNNALEIWLQLRKEINSSNEKNEQLLSPPINEKNHNLATDIKFEVQFNHTCLLFEQYHLNLGEQSL